MDKRPPSDEEGVDPLSQRIHDLPGMQNPVERRNARHLMIYIGLGGAALILLIVVIAGLV